ncbi:acyl-CoA thioesterase [Streptomyces mirabilis]|uniref:acyl-CoA thioesterase n=1 Tax=Streptomyces mirabilis TaxID=68239 RepID=UPI003826CB1C
MSLASDVLLSDSRASVSHVTTARDANIYGYVSGALQLKMIDDAALVLAVRVAQGPAVTARVERMDFLAPVRVGDVLHAHADLMRTGRSSMHIRVEIYSERMGLMDFPILVGTATLVFVAVDSENKSRPLRSDASSLDEFATEPGIAADAARR